MDVFIVSFAIVIGVLLAEIPAMRRFAILVATTARRAAMGQSHVNETGTVPKDFV
jgi:hypothetical protein